MQVWSLTTNDNEGLDTALYLEEVAAYEALIELWFPAGDIETAINRRDALASLALGVPSLIRWIDAVHSQESDARAVVIEHNHPWTFGEKAIGDEHAHGGINQ